MTGLICKLAMLTKMGYNDHGLQSLDEEEIGNRAHANALANTEETRGIGGDLGCTRPDCRAMAKFQLAGRRRLSLPPELLLGCLLADPGERPNHRGVLCWQS